MPGPALISPLRAAALGCLAAAIHAGLDALLHQAAWARPPWLRLEEMPEGFRELPFVSAPAAVSVATSAVGGVLAVLALYAVEPGVARRGRLLAGLLTLFWFLPAFLTWLVWLEAPFLRVLPGILLGVPRGLLLGWLLDRLSRPAPAEVIRRRA